MLMGVAYILVIIAFSIDARHKTYRNIAFTVGIIACIAALIVGIRTWTLQLIAIAFFWIICFIVGKIIGSIIKVFSKKSNEGDQTDGTNSIANKVSPLIVDELSKPEKIEYDPQRTNKSDPDAKYKPPTNKGDNQ